jgi:hypothetical protein
MGGPSRRFNFHLPSPDGSNVPHRDLDGGAAQIQSVQVGRGDVHLHHAAAGRRREGECLDGPCADSRSQGPSFN